MKYFDIIEFQAKGDETGSLVAIESGTSIPFDIKRVYYVYQTTKGAIRGKHSHKKLEQLIFCPIGTCDFILHDGKTQTIVKLTKPNQALYVKSNIWQEFTNFSKDCVVVVLASEHYDEKDYIRDYDEFIRSTK